MGLAMAVEMTTVKYLTTMSDDSHIDGIKEICAQKSYLGNMQYNRTYFR